MNPKLRTLPDEAITLIPKFAMPDDGTVKLPKLPQT